MAATFVVVPQWQGSGSSRAMRLVDGAEAIRGDLPSASTRSVARRKNRRTAATMIRSFVSAIE